MKPYYEHAGIVIYHADCRDVLGELTLSQIVNFEFVFNFDTESA